MKKKKKKIFKYNYKIFKYNVKLIYFIFEYEFIF